jgi:protein SMG6
MVGGGLVDVEILSPVEECGEGTDGRIEDDDDDEGFEKKSGMTCELVRWWVRIVRCAVGISDAVEGFKLVEGSRVEGVLKEKVQEWREEEREEREEEN